MNFDKKEWDELNKKPPIEKPKELLRAAVDMRLLTGSEQWDKFLTILEPLAKKAEKEQIILEEKILSPRFMEMEQMAYLKSEYVRVKERAETIRAIMVIPKNICSAGRKVADDTP